MKRFGFALAILALRPTVHAESCKTELKLTDGYRELSAILQCLKDEIEKLKGEAGKASPAVPGKAALPSAPAGGTLKGNVGPLTIELTGCRKVSGSVACQIKYLSPSDGALFFGGRSRLFDDTGQAHEISRVSGKSIIGGFPSEQALVAGIFYQTDIQFDGVFSASVSKLELQISHDNRQWVTPVFRNIPISD